MSITRLYRLLQMITLLRSGRRYDADALAQELGVSRRTVFRDLNLLEAAGIPYYFDEEVRSYTINRSFFLPAINLTVDEALALLLATRKLIARQRLPLFQHATRAAVKVESALPSALQEYCGSILDHVDVRWPPVADGEVLDENFNRLRQAIIDRRKVQLHYRSLYEGRTIRTTLSPYKLTFIHRAWYVIGHSSAHNDVRTFKVTRIENIHVLEEKYCYDGQFSLDDYLGHAWVMIPEGRRYRVRLQFTPKVAQNVSEVAWHRTQRSEFLPDGSLRFEVDVDGLNEISWWILGYGDQVKVLHPPQLRDRIQRIAHSMTRLYGDREKRK